LGFGKPIGNALTSEYGVSSGKGEGGGASGRDNKGIRRDDKGLYIYIYIYIYIIIYI
jgi:hypothetical protein